MEKILIGGIPKLKIIEGGKRIAETEKRAMDENNRLQAEVEMMTSDPAEDTFEFIEEDEK